MQLFLITLLIFGLVFVALALNVIAGRRKMECSCRGARRILNIRPAHPSRPPGPRAACRQWDVLPQTDEGCHCHKEASTCRSHPGTP